MFTKKSSIILGILSASFLIYTFDYFNNQIIISSFYSNSDKHTNFGSKKIKSNQEFLAVSSTSPSNSTMQSLIQIVSEYLKLSSTEKQVVTSSVVVSGSSNDQTPLTISPDASNSASNLLKIKDESGSDVLKVSKEGNLELNGVLTFKETEEDPEEKDNKGQIYITDEGKNLYYLDNQGKKVKLNSKTDALWSKSDNVVYLPTKYTNVGIGTQNPILTLDVANASGFGSATNRVVLGRGMGPLQKGLYISYGSLVSDKVTIQAEHQGTAYRDILLNPLGGNIGIGTSDPVTALDINSDTLRLEDSRTITSSTEPCTRGEISWDSDSIYVCIASDTWKKASLASW